ncbi:hypothetical protein pqer_cds_730 [Pandoravirus quercus]|uniref:Uncharacterized protein n=2 Tax=Pandoravirus TaxID=2060084 RepID=A0A2U7U9S8_9VIRU|nr:hypothetical protein pqer_cds_730 [Pandoravirus quercus]AVK75152.1 hypothetical protein pqer_cds_730 [Pandoravirus quercus]QBZ81317.1 hypothetical protein pclt_cds_731 [Pandoravirus celtis]
MAGLAVATVGLATGAVGFVAGLVATGVAVLLGPHVANLVSHWTCAAALLVLGSTTWSWTWSQTDFDTPPSPDDPLRAVAHTCIVTTAVGYAAACTTALGASILWNSTIPGARDCARALLAIPFILFFLIFSGV